MAFLMMSASGAALIAAGMMPQAARAADYSVSNEADLRNAINDANLQSGPSTITLTGSFTVTAVYLPVPTKPITIDTNGFTLTGQPGTANGALMFTSTGGNIVTINGNLAGGTGIPGTTTGGYGLWVQTDGGSSFVNNGSIVGGDGAVAGGRGGNGVRTRTGTFLNNGTIQGGEGHGVLQGGVGIELVSTDLTNTGLIQGGSSAANGGAGIQAIAGTANSLINTGTIRGGTGASGSVLASGVLWGTGFAVLDNRGTIEGGTGGPGIWSGTNIRATNSGTIRAGAGQANAIMSGSGAANFMDLTLLAGSVIDGNVAASAGGNNDILRLGGDTNWTLDGGIGSAGQYRNFDTLVKTGASTWTLTGSGDFAGAINVLAGKLLVNGSLADSVVTVGAGAILGGSGTVGATTLAAGGTIAPGNSIGTLFINGDYAGSGGVLEMEAVLSGTGSPADRLAISGNATGTTTIQTVNLGGTGALTGSRNTDGVSIVQVGGTSSAGAFELAGGYAAAGPYRYQLVAFDPASSDGGEMDAALAGAGILQFWDYRLQSVVDANGNPVPVPQIGAYQSLPTGALRYGATLLDSLHRRLGELHHNTAHLISASAKGPAEEVFLRQRGSRTNVAGDRGASYDQDIWFTQFGGNLAGWHAGEGDGLWRLGAAIGIGGSELEVDDTGAQVDLHGTSFALTGTYLAQQGAYVDTVVQVTRYSSDITTRERGRAGEPDGWGAGVSVETGYPLRIGDGLIVEPQAQLSYQRAWFDTFTDVDNIAVDLNGGESLRGRLGGRLQQTFAVDAARWSPFVEANLLHEFLDSDGITASNTTFGSDNDGTSLQVGGGLNAQLSPGTAVFAQVSYQHGLTDGAGDTLGGNLGLRLTF